MNKEQKNSTLPDNSGQKKIGRRAFLNSAGTLAMATVAATTLGQEESGKPRELPLHEADFYAPHPHVG